MPIRASNEGTNLALRNKLRLSTSPIKPLPNDRPLSGKISLCRRTGIFPVAKTKQKYNIMIPINGIILK